MNLQIEVQSKTCPLLNRLKDKMNRKISEADLDATTRYDLHTRLEGMPKHNKLCHGDFNPSNVIIADDGTAYVIDWSHATQGNASADVARTYLLFWLNGDIDGANEYLDLFCEKPIPKTIRPEMDAHRCGFAIGKGQRKGTRIPVVLGKRRGVSITVA